MESDGGISSEILGRHGHSAQPESQQIVAVFHAVVEVIASEGMTVSPVSLFAAVMSSLDRPETQGSPNVSMSDATFSLDIAYIVVSCNVRVDAHGLYWQLLCILAAGWMPCLSGRCNNK